MESKRELRYKSYLRENSIADQWVALLLDERAELEHTIIDPDPECDLWMMHAVTWLQVRTDAQ